MAHDLATPDILAEKLAQASEVLQREGIDLWLTYVQETSSGAERAFAYLSPGHLTWESLVAVRPDGRRFLVCGRFDQQVFEKSGLYDEVITYVQDFEEPFAALLSRFSLRKVAVNYSLEDPAADGIPHGRFLHLEALLKKHAPQAQIVPAEAVIGALISQKTPRERALIQKAVDHTVELFREVDAYLRPGLTEKEVYGFIGERMAARGLSPSFETLVFAGDRGAGMGHGEATENPLTPGDLVHVDMGVFVEGYASDMQRTWYLLKPGEDGAPEPVRKGFAVIVEAIARSGEALKPGVRGTDVDAVARAIVAQAGFPEYPHALGHQVGRHVHDGGCLLGPPWPRYRNTPFLPVREDQVFTLEPSLNVPGCGAVGVEEDVLVTAQGVRYFAEPQKELWLIRR